MRYNRAGKSRILRELSDIELRPACQAMTMPETSVPSSPLIPRRIWLLACAAVCIRIITAWGTHFTNEDFLITLRYADNLAHGQGLVYNVGEWHLGTTTPLYTLYLATCIRLGLSPFVMGKGINILADGLLCLVVFRWLSCKGYRAVGMIAAFVIAVHPWSIRWAVSGMETSLVTLGSAAAWLCLSERRYRVGYALLGILFLLRWDSLLLTAVFTVAAIARERRSFWREWLLFVVIVLPWIWFATWRYGSPVPSTMLAKATVYGWRFRGVFLPELRHLGAYLIGAPMYAAMSIFAVVGLARLCREQAGEFLPAVVWFCCYWAAFLLSKNLLFPWYLVPPLPVYVLLASLGMDTLLRALPAKFRPLRALLFAGGVTAGLSMTVVAFVGCRESQSIEDNLRLPLALWLKHATRPTDRVLLEPIGYVGYYSGRPILDVIGLTTPYVLPEWNPYNASPYWSIARRYRPEWCVLRPGEWEHVKAASAQAGQPWDKDYLLVKTFQFKPSPTREPVTFHVFCRKYVF